MRPRFSKVTPDYQPFGGGLDLLTPAIAMPPGKVISAQNYEPVIGGGYRRIGGYERYSGQPSPSQAVYYVIGITLTGSIAVGNTVTGVTSGATAKVLAISGATLVISRLTGVFVAAENLQVGGTTRGVSTSVAVLQGVSSRSDDADYLYLAAEDLKADIAAIPGSGTVWVHRYNGTLYAFRDNVGATASLMYKESSSGWTAITFGKEIQFTGAVGEIFAGNTITGLTSGATALVVKPMLRAGTWTVSGVGTLIISTVTGTWQSGEAIQVGGITKATSSSLATDIARAGGGTMEFVNANFTGSTATKKMYGCDGVNLAFEFDGTNYIPIRTGMTTDTPSHVYEHKNYLFLSFRGSVQFSGLGAPYAWTAVLGAGEITTGSEVTAFMVQAGTSSGSSLAIFTEGLTFILYGSSSANFLLTPSVDDIGSLARTAQSIGNDTMILTNRGIQRLKTTLAYGNFEYASVSHLIQPLITAKRGMQTASTALKTRNQYRVYFNDGSGIAVGLTGDKINGMLPLMYGVPVLSVCTDEDDDGKEVTYFGSDDGFVYQDNVGTSFDGDDIEAWIRLPFNSEKAPRIRKRYRAAILELVAEGFSQINVTYDLGYGTLDVAQGVAALDSQLLAAGGYWDQFTWDQFTWDAQAINNPRISLDGIEKTISLLFYSSRHQDNPHVLQGVTLITTSTRLER